jgi:cell division protein FtsZ
MTMAQRQGDVEETRAGAARLLVAGVGGAGGNAVRGLLRAGLPGVELLAINTDAQALAAVRAPRWLRIGPRLTRGLGAGGDPEVGLRAAEESRDAIRASLAGSDMVFLAAGLGGGTGTGAGPAVASIARELGALVVAVVSTPFAFEGERRRQAAERGLAALSEQVDTLIVVPNERLLELAGPEMRLSEAYALADDVLRQGVRAVSDLVALPGHINLDFADVRAVLADAGSAVLGVGQASGADRVAEALAGALSHPLLEREVTGARSALVHVSGGPDLTLRDVSQVVDELRRRLHPSANVLFGTAEDAACAGALRVTVVASGFAPHIAHVGGGAPHPLREAAASLPHTAAAVVAFPRRGVAAAPPRPLPPEPDGPRTGPARVRPAG